MVEFYLYNNSTWNYQEVIGHLRTSFESDRIFSSLVSGFYSRVQQPWETEDQWFDELQILSLPAWKDKSMRD